MEIEIFKIPVFNNGYAYYSYLGEQQHGDQKIYWDNGKLLENYFCVYDSWEKMYKLFNYNGSRDNLKQFKNNKEHGPNIEFIYKQKLKKSFFDWITN